MRHHAKHLTRGVAIYGAGDAAVSVVNFLLLPVYVKFNILTPVDYGALALILAAETFAKVIARWGLDGSFMRYYLEREAGAPRRALASTIVWFMVVADGLLLGAALAGSRGLAHLLSLDPAYLTALRLMLVNIALMAFTFVPLHSMRMQDQAVVYSAFSFARSAGTMLLRIVLVIGLRLGVTGMYLTDLILTVVLLVCMWPWIRPLVGLVFSLDEFRTALRFGLPRLPAGLASQTLDSAPRIALGRSLSAGAASPLAAQAEVGVYQNGVALGTGVAFFKNAFETAWAPFYYATSRQPDAKEVFSKMTTYGVAVVVLLVAGTTAVARDVIYLMLTPKYLDALPVVPLVAIAMGLQSVYQLTSIGLNLTRRTEFYSLSTMVAAGVSLALAAWLIPRAGVLGAAETVLAAYATQLVVAASLSQWLYPVRYEGARLVRIVASGALAAFVARDLVPALPHLVGFLARGSVTVLVYTAALWASGFFRATERAFLRETIARLRRRPTAPAAVGD